MIQDKKKWNLGVSLLSGFMQHVPGAIDEDCVQQYHGIVLLLEQSSGEDLSLFKIPDDKLARKLTSFAHDLFGDGSGSATYSKERFCDGPFFRSQLHGLSNYIQVIKGPTVSNKGSRYDSLTDEQLQSILADRNLKPKRTFDERGETKYEFDRAHAIASLLKDDHPSSPASISNTYNIRDSNFINRSPGASITETTTNVNELLKILAALKEISSTQQLPPEERAQMKTDIGTIELQMDSPRPNNSIIRASLESVATILEHAAGIIVGEVTLMAIKGYLGMS